MGCCFSITPKHSGSEDASSTAQQQQSKVQAERRRSSTSRNVGMAHLAAAKARDASPGSRTLSGAKAIPEEQVPAQFIALMESGNMGGPFHYIAANALAGDKAQHVTVDVDTAINEVRKLGLGAISSVTVSTQSHACGMPEWRRSGSSGHGKSFYSVYEKLTVYGVLLVADTKEQLATWQTSKKCQQEFDGVHSSRLFIYHQGRIVPKVRLDECVAGQGFEHAYTVIFKQQQLRSRKSDEMTNTTTHSNSTPPQTRNSRNFEDAKEAELPRSVEAVSVMLTNSPDKYAKTVKKLESKLSEYIKRMGHDHMDVAAGYARIAEVHCEFGQYDKALEKYEQTLRIQIEKDPGGKEIGNTYKCMGDVLSRLGRNEESLKYFEKSLDVIVRVFSCEDVRAADCMDRIALVFLEMGRVNEALGKHQEALAIRRKVQSGRRDVAACLANIGTAQMRLGDVGEALKSFEESLGIYDDIYKIEEESEEKNRASQNKNKKKEQEGGEGQGERGERGERGEGARGDVRRLDRRDVVRIYRTLGALFAEQEEYEQSLEYHKKELETSRSVYGMRHVDVATALINVAVAHDGMGMYEESLRSYQEALEIQIAALGDDHVDVAGSYCCIGDACMKLGEFKKALDAHQSGLKINRKRYGDVHEDVAKSYGGIAAVYRAMQQFDKAVLYFDKAKASSKFLP